MAPSNTEDSTYSQHTRLLDDNTNSDNSRCIRPKTESSSTRVLPVSLLCSIAIHITAASTVWVYAYLFCKHPEQCKNEEKRQYAGSVATATAVANAAGLLALGYLTRIVNWDARAGLVVWLLCRSLGVLGLAIGVHFHSFSYALGGQILQGLASDNLLHFNLNSIYTYASSTHAISMLMGSSLALYMIGMAVGPAVAGFLPSFTWTFAVAAALFSITMIYVLMVIPSHRHASPVNSEPTLEASNDKFNHFAAVLAPARLFYERPRSIIQGLSLFFYNMVQGYLINLIFVFASVQFSFTSRENGFLLSLIAVVAATYLLGSLFIVPRLISWLGWPLSPSNIATPHPHGTGADDYPSIHRGRKFDLVSGALAILTQTVAAATLSQVHHPSLIYIGASLTALGLAAPSFVKSYFVASLPDATQGVAALALMETSGGLVSPLVLGAWQAQHPDNSVFYLASGILGLSLACLVGGSLI